MKDLINKLNKAAEAYYNGIEIMSNYEYDQLYDELVRMEAETGIIYPDSPTQKVGAAVVSKLPKDKHEYPMLSLDKTKDANEIKKIFSVRDNLAVLMWKMDGSTVVATYDNGKLTKLVTRGTGEEGSVITHNAPFIKGLPINIPYKRHLVVRGEAVMSYSEFNRINSLLPPEEQYANPRNLANATIQLLDSNKMAEREIRFYAFNLVHVDDELSPDTFAFRLLFLKNQGINTVEAYIYDAEKEIVPGIEEWTKNVSALDYPVDGLVVALNDVLYAEKQPGTGHHPNKLVGFAFKWADVSVQTVLRKIEWSASRTGLLNPVAVFDPVEIEGTTVSRASLHNVSYILDLNLKPGDRIMVYKANLIIPQISSNLDKTLHEYVLPGYIDGIRFCPACGSPTNIERSVKSDGSVTLTCHCMNPECAAKKVGKFVHFCERDCMNIEGMSETTIEKFVERGFLKEYKDFWHIDRFKDEIVNMPGFGQKSYDNMVNAIENARYTDFVSFIHALGIPHVGKGQAKLLNKVYKNDVRKFLRDCCNGTDFTEIDGIGDVINQSIHRYIFIPMQSGPDNSDCELTRLLKEVRFSQETAEVDEKLDGKTFVITGSLNYYANRDALIDVIERLGGRVSGSVSKNTSYLINNDVTSSSGKNKKAKELGVEIISEEQFLSMIQ